MEIYRVNIKSICLSFIRVDVNSQNGKCLVVYTHTHMGFRSFLGRNIFQILIYDVVELRWNNVNNEVEATVESIFFKNC